MAFAGLTATPEWLARALGAQEPEAAQDPQQAGETLEAWRWRQLQLAVAQAKDHGKPMLVLVAPAKEVAREHGTWFGAWLTHGGPLAMQELALTVVAVASRDEITRLTGREIEAVPGPQMVLVDVARLGEAGAPAAKLTGMAPALAMPAIEDLAQVVGDERVAQERKAREVGLEQMTAALHDGMNRHGCNLANLAVRAEARLDAAQRAALTEWLANGGDIDAALLVRAAAVVRRDFGRLPDGRRVECAAALADAVDATVVRHEVGGSRWYQPGGCGGSYEELTDAEKARGRFIMACGMGIVPPLCERFLDFYSVGR